ncbi:NAD(P)-dependent oxidoreductase [Chitinophaga japonensis]|uniref:3-hydroxyisobutyrate dehydrogenase n=1 Tax=Chitinophaga japonensis TaxID=104662 RepID=A0A562T6H9_CHIJA|nr:NAD(P)-dependent oxidoreductase [Chitinophaga japonensis]TWI88963.1 3-hydroxyisobutyrate dehydrogenase [Chitinophaga japonensis]
MKAFLGMGLLGSNFVKAMIKKGDQVQVWNRTSAKATVLEAIGAKAFPDPAAAVQQADIVHLALKDDDAVNEVLALAAPGLKPGATIIDHTTTAVAGAIQRTQEWKERGFTYLHAPVFMGPLNALESTGLMLVSGDQEVIGRLQPVLAAMTGKVINFGPATGRAAGMKLTGNLFLVGLTAGLADALSLSRSLDIPLDNLVTLFDSWNPGVAIQARLQRMAGGSYDQPSWELSMARKDTRLFMDAVATGGGRLAVIPAIAAEMDRWISKGHGNEDWTVIGSGQYKDKG